MVKHLQHLQHLQHLSSHVVLRVLVLLHVRSGPFPWIRSKILAPTLANPFAADLRRDPCYWQRRSSYVRVGSTDRVTREGPARRLAEPVTWNLPKKNSFFHSHFTFKLLDKPWSQVSSLLPPGSSHHFLSRRGFINRTARRVFIECC